jgi:hypothetical protein
MAADKYEIGRHIYRVHDNLKLGRVDAAIWAHGVARSDTFDISGYHGIRILFYVPKDYELTFSKSDAYQLGTFQSLGRQQLEADYECNSNLNTNVPNYDLNKAAGKHISNEAARMYYDDLKAIVDKNNFDIISIRNRILGFATSHTLEEVIKHCWSLGYTNFHCLFCRYNKNNEKGQYKQGAKRKANWKEIGK